MNKQYTPTPVMDVNTMAMVGTPEQSDERAADVTATLRAVWSAAFRNRWLILAIVAAALLLGVVATMLASPRYQAAATVQIDQQEAKVLGSESVDPVDAAQDADRFLQTQIDVLKSRGIAIRVMESLRLGGDDRFVTAMGAKPIAKPMGTLDMAASKREQILKLLQDNLDVTLPRNSRVAQISFRSPDPILAPRVANSFAQNFIMANLKRKFDTSTYARGFLQQQLVETKERLEQSERAMLDYARSVGLIDASNGIGSVGGDGAPTNAPRSLVTSDLVQLNSAYAQARANRIQAEQRWSQANAAPLMSLQEVLTNPAITQLSQLRAQAQAAYDQDRQRHKPDFPGLQQLGAQISAYDAQIAQTAQSIKDSIRDQYRTAAKQENALAGNVTSLKHDTLSEQDRSVRYNILKRETDTNRTMYDGLLQRFKEVSAQSGISSNNISLIDTADVPSKPISPRPVVNLAVALLLGLAAAAVTVFLREKFDDAVRSPEDVRNKLGLTLLNSVPLLKSGEHPDEALTDPRSAMSESYAALRTSLELVDGEGMPETLLFTSSRSGEGKSTSAYAIARDFARLGKRVILVDSDLRRPSLHRALGLSNANGLSSVLARHRTLEQSVQQSGTENLDFLSTGPLPPSPADLLSGAPVKAVIQKLHESYDLVVIDGPPVLGLADAVLLASNVAGVIFVIEANGSHHGHAKAAIRRLQSGGAHIVGALLTKFDARKLGYGYGYGYSYYDYSYGNETTAEQSV